MFYPAAIVGVLTFLTFLAYWFRTRRPSRSPPSSPHPSPHPSPAPSPVPSPAPSPAPSPPPSPTVSRSFLSRIAALSSSSSCSSTPCSSRQALVQFAGSSLDSSGNSPAKSGRVGTGHNNRVDSWRLVIKQKLDARLKEHPELKKALKDANWTQEELITKLGDPVAFRNTFLIQSKFHHGQLRTEIEEEIRFFQGGSVMSAPEMTAAVQRMESRHELATDLPVKLVLTSLANIEDGLDFGSVGIGGAGAAKDIIREAANVAEFRFGALHSGILLGDTVLEWGRGLCGQSLICPSKPTTVLCAVDLENLTAWKKFKQVIKTIFDGTDGSFLSRLKTSLSAFLGLDDAHIQQLDQIAQLCTDWNRYGHYNVAIRNCQTFVADFCSKLELKYEFEGPKMREFMEILRRNGNAKFQFGGKTFETRSSLDDFVMNKIDYKNQEKDDRKLLTAYAHAFDINDAANPGNKKYKSTEKARQFWHDLSKWEKNMSDTEQM